MISGCTKRTYGRKKDSTMFIDTQSSQSAMTEINQFVPVKESLLHASIDELCKLETIEITVPDKKKDDHGAIEHFNNTVTKDNGRYQATGPGRSKDNELPKNYELALEDQNPCAKIFPIILNYDKIMTPLTKSSCKRE